MFALIGGSFALISLSLPFVKRVNEGEERRLWARRSKTRQELLQLRVVSGHLARVEEREGGRGVRRNYR